MRKSRVAGLVALLLVAMLAAAYAVGTAWYRQPLPLPRTPFDFDVRTGASLGTVARSLAAAGVVPHAFTLTALGRLKGVDRTIKAGSYEVEQGITLPELLAKLTQGDVTQTAITIVEGTTFAQLKASLRENPDVAHRSSGFPTRNCSPASAPTKRRRRGCSSPTLTSSPRAAATSRCCAARIARCRPPRGSLGRARSRNYRWRRRTRR